MGVNQRVLNLLAIRDELLLVTADKLLRTKVDAVEELKFTIFELGVKFTSGYTANQSGISLTGSLSTSFCLESLPPSIDHTSKAYLGTFHFETSDIDLYSTHLKVNSRHKQQLAPSYSSSTLHPLDVLSSASNSKGFSSLLRTPGGQDTAFKHNENFNSPGVQSTQPKSSSTLEREMPRRKTLELGGVNKQEGSATNGQQRTVSGKLASPPIQSLLKTPNAGVEQFESRFKEEMKRIEKKHRDPTQIANLMMPQQEVFKSVSKLESVSAHSVKNQIDCLMSAWGDDPMAHFSQPSRQKHIDKIRDLISGSRLVATEDHTTQLKPKEGSSLEGRLTTTDKVTRVESNQSPKTNIVTTMVKKLEKELPPGIVTATNGAIERQGNPLIKSAIDVPTQKANYEERGKPQSKTQIKEKVEVDKRQKIAQLRDNLNKIEIVPAELLSNKETIDYELSDGSDGRSRDEFSRKVSQPHMKERSVSPPLIPSKDRPISATRPVQFRTLQDEDYEYSSIFQTENKQSDIRTSVSPGIQIKQNSVTRRPQDREVEATNSTPFNLRTIQEENDPSAIIITEPNPELLENLFTNNLLRGAGLPKESKQSLHQQSSSQLATSQVSQTSELQLLSLEPPAKTSTNSRLSAPPTTKPSQAQLKAFLLLLNEKFKSLNHSRNLQNLSKTFSLLRLAASRIAAQQQTTTCQLVLRALADATYNKAFREVSDFLFEFKFWLAMDKLVAVCEAAGDIVSLRRALAVMRESRRGVVADSQESQLQFEEKSPGSEVGEEEEGYEEEEMEGEEEVGELDDDRIDEEQDEDEVEEKKESVEVVSAARKLNHVEQSTQGHTHNLALCPEEDEEYEESKEKEDPQVLEIPKTRLDDLSVKKILIATKTLVTQKIYINYHDFFARVRKRSEQRRRKGPIFSQKVLGSLQKFNLREQKYSFLLIKLFSNLRNMVSIIDSRLEEVAFMRLRQFYQDRELLACTASEITIRDDSLDLGKKQSAKKFQLAQYIQTHLNPTLRSDSVEDKVKESRNREQHHNTLEEIRNELCDLNDRRLEEISGFSKQLGDFSKHSPAKNEKVNTGAHNLFSLKDSPTKVEVVDPKKHFNAEKASEPNTTDKHISAEEHALESHRATTFTLRGSGNIDFDTFKKKLDSESDVKLNEVPLNSKEPVIRSPSLGTNTSATFKNPIEESRRFDNITPIHQSDNARDERPDSAVAACAAALATHGQGARPARPGITKNADLVSKTQAILDKELPTFTSVIKGATKSPKLEPAKSQTPSEKSFSQKGESQIEKIQANLNHIERIYKETAGGSNELPTKMSVREALGSRVTSVQVSAIAQKEAKMNSSSENHQDNSNLSLPHQISMTKEQSKMSTKENKDWKPPIGPTKTQESFRNFFKKIDSAKKSQHSSSENTIANPSLQQTSALKKALESLEEERIKSTDRRRKTNSSKEKISKLTLGIDGSDEKTYKQPTRPHSTKARHVTEGSQEIIHKKSGTLTSKYFSKETKSSERLAGNLYWPDGNGTFGKQQQEALNQNKDKGTIFTSNQITSANKKPLVSSSNGKTNSSREDRSKKALIQKTSPSHEPIKPSSSTARPKSSNLIDAKIHSDRRPHIKIKDSKREVEVSASGNKSSSRIEHTVHSFNESTARLDTKKHMDSSMKSVRTGSISSIERKNIDTLNNMDYRKRYEEVRPQVSQKPTYVKISEAKKRYFTGSES